MDNYLNTNCHTPIQLKNVELLTDNDLDLINKSIVVDENENYMIQCNFNEIKEESDELKKLSNPVNERVQKKTRKLMKFEEEPVKGRRTKPKVKLNEEKPTRENITTRKASSKN